ncbi:MAG: cupin domain-containing protein [Gordonia sp. (in: high G+C Gram-positive bacteria)]
MPLLTAASATTYELHGVRFHSFAASPSGATSLAAWRADFPPHSVGAAHSLTAEEVLHVLSGSLEVQIDDDEFTARAGDAVLVPAGSRFRVSNADDVPASAWVATTLGMKAEIAEGGLQIAPPWAQ